MNSRFLSNSRIIRMYSLSLCSEEQDSFSGLELHQILHDLVSEILNFSYSSSLLPSVLQSDVGIS